MVAKAKSQRVEKPVELPPLRWAVVSPDGKETIREIPNPLADAVNGFNRDYGQHGMRAYLPSEESGGGCAKKLYTIYFVEHLNGPLPRNLIEPLPAGRCVGDSDELSFPEGTRIFFATRGEAFQEAADENAKQELYGDSLCHDWHIVLEVRNACDYSLFTLDEGGTGTMNIIRLPIAIVAPTAAEKRKHGKRKRELSKGGAA